MVNGEGKGWISIVVDVEGNVGWRLDDFFEEVGVFGKNFFREGDDEVDCIVC